MNWEAKTIFLNAGFLGTQVGNNDIGSSIICPQRDWRKVKRKRGGIALDCKGLRGEEFCVKGRIYKENA